MSKAYNINTNILDDKSIDYLVDYLVKQNEILSHQNKTKINNFESFFTPLFKLFIRL